MVMALQLPLGIVLRDGATFDNFLAADNGEVISHLRDAWQHAPSRGMYCWGPAACGKTHLLQAVCHEAARRGDQALYLPLQQVDEWQPRMLESLEGLAVVCVDDLQYIAGRRDWQEALFHLYNRMLANAALFIATGSSVPDGLGLELPDLVSRLSWGGVYRIHALTDEGKQQALILRAGQRGLQLPDDVARYLLRHYPRDLHALMTMLQELDVASLAEQRRLTIPFVRETILGREA